MDAKFFTSKSLGVSGLMLLWVLAVGLILAAVFLDVSMGNTFDLGTSLTVPLVVSAIATSALGFWAVPLLRALKTGQFIREEGPQAHFKKAGTPTMGGIFFIPVAVLVALLATGFAPATVAVSGLTLAYAGIGWLDDWQVLQRKSNKGISPKTKLLLQIGFALAFCLWMLISQPSTDRKSVV